MGETKKLPLVGAWILVIGAVAAVAYVRIESIAAYEDLKTGAYGFGPQMRDLTMLGRMRDAGYLLIAGSVAALGALVLSRVGGRGRLAGRLPAVLACAALGAAIYVWVCHGGEIVRAL
jgi:hypothetical protein